MYEKISYAFIHAHLHSIVNVNSIFSMLVRIYGIHSHHDSRVQY